MSHSERLTHRDVLRVMRLMADVAALKGNPAAQRQHFIDKLNDIVGTNQAFVYGAAGWHPGGKPRFTSYTLTQDRDLTFLRYVAEFGISKPLEADPFCDFSIREKKKAQLWSFDQVLPDRDSERHYSDFMEIRRSGRVNDGLVSLVRLDDDAIVGVGMHQFGSARALKIKERAIAMFAVRELGRLAKLGHFELVTPPPKELSPRLQQVFCLLLEGNSAKRIARTLGLSIWTVREYVQRIYRHHGVNGHEELMARFIHQKPSPVDFSE